MEKKEKIVLIFSVSLIVFAIFLYNYLPDLVLGYKPHNANFIGLTTHADGDVQVRFGDSINWKKLQKNDGIYARSYLFTGANSSGSYAFLDESTINLEQNSLVFLNFHPTAKKSDDAQALSIDLLEGNVKLALPKDSNIKSITMNETTLEPGKEQTSLKLESGSKVEVMVMEGEINVTKEMVNVNVKAGRSLVFLKEVLQKKKRSRKSSWRR
jgi:hypothetical protein